MKTPEGKFYQRTMNGPLEIHHGPNADTPEEAKRVGKEHMGKVNPGLYINTYHELPPRGAMNPHTGRRG